MLELKHSGLPLYINEQDYMMALSGQLKLGGYARKNTDKMIGLLENEANLKPDDPFYDVYRAGTNELLYTYEIISESSDYTDLRTCKAYTEEFYNNLGHAISEQKKKAAKKK